MSARQKIKAFSFAGALSLNILLAMLLVISAQTQARTVKTEKTEESTKICLSVLQMRNPTPVATVPVAAVMPAMLQPEKRPVAKPVKKQVVKKKITPIKPAPQKTIRPKVVKPVKKTVPSAKETPAEPQRAAVQVLPDPAMARKEAAARAARRKENQRQSLVAKLIRRLEKEKKFPLLARRLGVSGTVLLLIEVQPDGVISHYEIVEKQSAHNILKKAALTTARKAAAKPLAMCDLDRCMLVKVPIIYELI